MIYNLIRIQDFFQGIVVFRKIETVILEVNCPLGQTPGIKGSKGVLSSSFHPRFGYIWILLSWIGQILQTQKQYLNPETIEILTFRCLESSLKPFSSGLSDPFEKVIICCFWILGQCEVLGSSSVFFTPIQGYLFYSFHEKFGKTIFWKVHVYFNQFRNLILIPDYSYSRIQQSQQIYLFQKYLFNCFLSFSFTYLFLLDYL